MALGEVLISISENFSRDHLTNISQTITINIALIRN
jgi:hypothetical protein